MSGETGNWNNIQGHEHIYANRMPCIAATKLIIEEELRHNFPGHDPILEVGAGMGVLQSLVSEDDRKRMISSDLNLNPLIQFRRNFPQADLVQINAITLPFSDGQFKNVVSLAALDVLTDKNLGKAARELHRVTTDDGTFMHILDILPDITVLMEPLVKRKKIPFIYYNSENRMRLAFVDQKAFLQKTEEGIALRQIEKVLGNIAGAKKFLNLLQKYGRNPIASVLDFATNDLSNAVEIEKGLIKALELLHISYEITEPIEVMFGNKLVGELKSAGFKDVLMITPTKRITIPRSGFNKFGIQKTDSNFFDNNVGNAISYLLPEIAEQFGKDKIVLQSAVQIIVAKK